METPKLKMRRRSSKRFDAPSYLYTSVPGLLDRASPLIHEAIARKNGSATRIPQDVVEWAEERFYIPATGKPIVLAEHQKAVLRLALTRNEEGSFPYRTIIYSTIKQSGKSTIAGLITRWYAETQRRYSEIYCIGNDLEQAKSRSFREVRWSIELTPGYDQNRERLPGEWEALKTIMRCTRTSSEIRALAVDARGEAGGKPALQVWTELWGYEHTEALRFWEELTPIPTIPDSMRIVETYAGYEAESILLKSIYDTGKAGHQLTAQELADRTGAPLDAFVECAPSDPVPIWENKSASMLMYWDSGVAARRMPWQVGEKGAAYYAEQEESLPPQANRRLHHNEWGSAESAFIPQESWDRNFDADLIPDPVHGGAPLIPGDRTPIVLGVDAATSGDCFAVVAVSRNPKRTDEPAVRAVRVWDPKESGGTIDHDECERWLRAVCEAHNVVQIAYDPYQLEYMMQRLRKDAVAWCEPFTQQGDRLKADKQLYDLILQGRMAHNGDQRLREHILNAGAKVQKDQDSTLRLVKVSQQRKIDAAVALSMAAARCLYLRLA